MIKDRKYALIRAMVKRPASQSIDFELPRSALQFLPEGEDPTGPFLPVPESDGYEIVVMRKHFVQRIYAGGQLIYDRAKHGF